MPSTDLHIRPTSRGPAFGGSAPLPSLLQTPGGLAIVELQGTIHYPPNATSDPDENSSASSSLKTSVGRLEFPLYKVENPDLQDGSWMKQVYLYVGKHQRMNGEVKKLPKPLAVLRKQEKRHDHDPPGQGDDSLELIDVIRYKVLFASRPEPVGE